MGIEFGVGIIVGAIVVLVFQRLRSSWKPEEVKPRKLRKKKEEQRLVEKSEEPPKPEEPQ